MAGRLVKMIDMLRHHMQHMSFVYQ